MYVLLAEKNLCYRYIILYEYWYWYWYWCLTSLNIAQMISDIIS